MKTKALYPNEKLLASIQILEQNISKNTSVHVKLWALMCWDTKFQTGGRNEKQ